MLLHGCLQALGSVSSVQNIFHIGATTAHKQALPCLQMSVNKQSCLARLPEALRAPLDHRKAAFCTVDVCWIQGLRAGTSVGNRAAPPAGAAQPLWSPTGCPVQKPILRACKTLVNTHQA